MLEPDDRTVFACRTCHDFKRVYAGRKDVPCPECSAWPPEKRDIMLRSATKDKAEKPSIREVDLSDDEKALMKEWQSLHPSVNDLTLLTWIEGRRYDPEKDEAFLAEARKRFKKWQFYRNSNEGPVPEWAQAALATGDMKDLSKNDRDYVESLRRVG